MQTIQKKRLGQENDRWNSPSFDGIKYESVDDQEIDIVAFLIDWLMIVISKTKITRIPNFHESFANVRDYRCDA